jgi:TetR/AcrR family transcriptional regulator, transcriptional repressor for nem operon
MSRQMSRPARTRTPKPRAETMQATRAALIDAALEEFASRGLDASLDNICARAKLTRGAFYVHFADRDALIVAVMDHVLGRFVELLTAARIDSGGIERAVQLFVAAAAARSPAVHGRRGLRFFHLMDACHRSKTVGEAYRALLASGRDGLGAGVERDQTARRIRTDVAPGALAELMMVVALGIVAAIELDVPVDVQRLGTTVLGLASP